MTHAAGDTGWVAWTNTVDAQVAAAQADILARLTAVLAASTYVPLTDARLTDARTPTAHTQTASTITDFTAAVTAVIAAGGAFPAWTAYTATLTGWTLGGTGAASSYVWRREGDLIRVRYSITCGTGGSAPSGAHFTLPVPSVAFAAGFMLVGVGTANHASASYFCPPGLDSTTQVLIVVGSSPLSALAPTSPFTWAAGDVASGELTYRPA